jgi:anti-sigma B factor antagonist
MARETARPSVTVTFPEEVDLTNSAAATAAVFDALGSHDLVIVDMSGTTFCDSSGMRMLLVARNHAALSGSVLRIVITPGGAVARLLAVLGMTSMLPVYDSLHSARQADLGAAPAADCS